MVPDPPAIDKRLLLALVRAAGALWRATVRSLPHELDRNSRKVLRKAIVPLNTRATVIGLLVLHPDWTGEEIAKAAGICRGRLYQVPGFKDIRDQSKAYALAERRRGATYIDSRTGTRQYVVDDAPEPRADDAD
jgi:hypothetical protein